MALPEASASGVVLPASLLMVVLLVAVSSDLRARRIPNSLILASWSVALAWHSLAAPGTWAFDSTSPGAVGFLRALLAGAILLLAFMPFYGLRIMGAGDVKLMSVVGMFFGLSGDAWVQLLGVSLFVLAAGGLLASGRMLASRSSAAVLANLRLIFSGYAGRLLGMPAPSFDPLTDSADRMPYAVAIATGTLLYLVAKWAGWITVL